MQISFWKIENKYTANTTKTAKTAKAAKTAKTANQRAVNKIREHKNQWHNNR